MSKRVVFNEPQRNIEFQRDGYVIFRNCFSDTILAETFQQILSIAPEEDQQLSGWQNKQVTVPYYSTFLSKSQVYKKHIFNLISELFNVFIDTNLKDYKTIQTNIFNKPKGTGYVCPHQNLTTVDEDRFYSVSIWTPLQNITPQNGPLCLTPGSQGKFEKYRSTSIHWEPLKIANKIEDYKMIPIFLNTGDVIVFDDSIIHGSNDNNSNNERLVFHAIAIPSEAKAIYCKQKGDIIQLIQVEDTFWQYFIPGDNEPSTPIIKEVLYKAKTYTPDNIINEINNEDKTKF